jgi:hypothetical protein
MQVSRTPRSKFVCLCSAQWCLASEKRSSGKSLGWFWWVNRGYGDLKIAAVLDLAGNDARAQFVCSNSACIFQIY